MPLKHVSRDAATGTGSSFLNAILNVFWSVLCLVPVYLFCIHFVTGLWIYILGGVSLVPYFLPAFMIDRMAVSSSPATYRRLGVAFANRFTQDGVLVRNFAKRKQSSRSLVFNPVAIAKLQRQAFQRERFHLAGFVFFLLLTVRAAWLAKPGWALLLLASNVLYNVYPVLLQQYVRLRLRRVSRRQ